MNSHKTIQKAIFVIFAVFTFICTSVLSAQTEVIPGQTFETSDYIFFVPESIVMSQKHPLIVAFSPGADAKQLVRTWKGPATRHECLLFASKVIKNGMDVPMALKKINQQIEELAKTIPIAAKGIIAVGVSGGGMTAHLFSFFYPDTVSAVISNVGYIHENSLKKKSKYPKSKLAVLLTSPTDFNYKLMLEDKKYLESLNWRTKWMEFEGGHRQAPADMLDESLKWIVTQPEIVTLLQ